MYEAGNKNVESPSGGPSIDPTKNVLNLVDAAVKRLDDLRDMEGHHRTDIEALRAYYEEKLRVAESMRIDAIRAVDVEATRQTAQVAESRAVTLALQVASQADTLRSQVATVAAAAASTQATALAPIIASVEELRRNQYQQQGEKSAKTDTRAQANWGIGTVISVIFGIVGVLSLILTLTRSPLH